MRDQQEPVAAPIFSVDDWVNVKLGPPEEHCRTPVYLRGKRGRIVEIVGRYHNPSLLAFHKPGLPKLWLYRVRFQQDGIWNEYDGSNRDTVVADLYEHWLVPAEEHSNVAP
jgi:nitrile hydratase subunit beta